MTSWIWQRTPDNRARFVLGTTGAHPLVCFGINPSTAVPGALDPTVTRVSRFAAREEDRFDSWVMLNVSPQISTDPRGMHYSLDADWKAENERRIADIVAGRPLTLLAAWGTLIESRPYLFENLHEIVGLPELANCTWVSLGTPTKAGHPRHPLYLKSTTPLVPFDVSGYLQRR